MRVVDRTAARTFDAMDTLLLAGPNSQARQHFSDQWFKRELDYVFALKQPGLVEFLEQAQTQRVLRRILEVVNENLHRAKYDHTVEMVGRALSQERERARTATDFLQAIV